LINAKEGKKISTSITTPFLSNIYFQSISLFEVQYGPDQPVEEHCSKRGRGNSNKLFAQT
jgi:hypothetical protein